MPLYDFECTGCNTLFEASLKISERKIPTESPCPHCGETKVESRLTKAPGLVATAYTNIKTPDGFKDVLRTMKKGNPGCAIDV